jgi:hypothetical protein
MTDPLSGVAAAAAVGRAGLGTLGFLWDKVREADVIAREFDPDARPFDGGDERITVVRMADAADDTHWWYRVVLVRAFEFVPYATNPYYEIRFGSVPGEQRARDRLVFRWVLPPPVGYVFNSGSDPANVETNFVVVGYRPAAVVRHFTGR